MFNCFGDAYDVVSTVGEAFSIKYEDVLNKHSQCNTGQFEFIEVNTGYVNFFISILANFALLCKIHVRSTPIFISWQTAPLFYFRLYAIIR